MLFAVVAVCIITVPLAGGRLMRFAELPLNRVWLLLTAFGVQFLNYRINPAHGRIAHQAVYLASYGLAAAFLWANRRLPGLWLICIGALSNVIVIAANGGVMPGSMSAFSSAGLVAAPAHFVNSRALLHPHLLVLGDVFAVPSWLPFHNVFSIGDLCIVLGAFVGLHRWSESGLLPSGNGQFRVLMAEPDFLRLWVAQAVSNQGDWVYSLGVVASLLRQGATTSTLALVFVMQYLPRAVTSTFGGPLVDRFARKRIMIIADLVRAVAVLSLLFGGAPSKGHLYAVAACLGLFAALFQPSLQASIPNVVSAPRLMAANALVSVTFQLAVMTGPLIGALLVARVGVRTAFAVNAASFLVSAILVGTLRLPHQTPRAVGFSPRRELLEGFRYAASTPVIRGVLIVTGMVMMAAALRGPLEPVFLVQVLHTPFAALGLPAAVWGLGMLLGSSAAPAAARAWSRERLLTISIAMVGVCVFAAAQSRVLSSLLCLWLVAGSGNAVGTIAYQSLLQQRTPDALRGRIMAASEAVLDIAYLAGILIAGWLGGHAGLRVDLAVAGGLFLCAAAVSHVSLGRGTPPSAAATGDSVPARPVVHRYLGPAPLELRAPVQPTRAARRRRAIEEPDAVPADVRIARMTSEIDYLARREAELLA